MNLSQTFTIARYEIVMNWRQRAIPVFTLALIALPVFFAFFVRKEVAADPALMEQLANLGEEGMKEYARANTASVQFFTWAAMYLILIIMAPLIMSAIIPKDRQLMVRELLDGLPITPATYLNGKLLGAWGALLSGVVVALILVLVTWRLVLGPIYLPPILSAWLGGSTVLVIFNTSLSILLAAGQSTRKRAFAISTFIAMASLGFFVVVAFRSFSAPQDYQWWEILSPARSPLYNYFIFTSMVPPTGGFPEQLTNITSVWQTFAAGVIETILLWFAAHQYVRTR